MNSLCVIALNHALSQSAPFQAVLAALAIDTNAISEQRFLAGDCSTSSKVFLFVLDRRLSRDAGLQRALLQHMKQHPRAIHLCLLDDVDLMRDQQLYQPFHDFLLWPCTAGEITARLRRFTGTPPHSDHHHLDDKLLEQFANLNLVGTSAIFRQTLALIRKLARCDAPVLVQGETGTGKENAARAIHYLGARTDSGFVPVNCGALPDELLESELFGYQKGAFTDAKESQPGLVKIAQGGTLFLDEVDSLSSKAQAALLRFLQTREYRPVGGKQTFHADVRIIAATNADLDRRVVAGSFREDLLFRLNVLQVVMPPLRQRSDDIPAIAHKLLQKFCGQYGLAEKRLAPPSLLWLSRQHWAGNVRELENVLLRHALLSEDSVLLIGDDRSDAGTARAETAAIELPIDTAVCFQQAKTDAIYRFEQHYLRQIMQRADGNVTEAARMSGKERRSLGKLLKKYNIDKHDYRRDTAPH